MIRYRLPFRRPRSLAVLLLLVLLCLNAVACDRALLDPALRDGDEAALLRAAGLTRPEGRYTLAGMVLEASRVLARADSGAAARALLEQFGRAHAGALAAAQLSAADAVAAARAEVRQAELAMVADVLGKPGAERAIAGVSGGLSLAGAALDSAASRREYHVAALREQRAEIARSLAVARASLDAGDVPAALDASSSAAERLLELRRGILDLDRVLALPDLYARAERALTAADGDFPGGAELLREHARLKEVAQSLVTGSDRQRAHQALTAVRESELQMTLEVLGPQTAARVVADVGKALGDLKAGSAAAQPRLRRMLRTAADLHYRASTALRSGDGIAALDLASYAAGLVNAYRLAAARF